MSYTITQNLISGLPRNPYRNGAGKYEGVVAHSTATPNATASAERTYESTHWNDAFVHYFVDWTSIVQTADTDYQSWHAGHTANGRYVGVELCETADANLFKQSYDRYVWLLAKILKDKGLPMVHMQTFFTHNDTSNLFKETTHTDPVGYLQGHGVSVSKLVADVTSQYNAMAGVKPVLQNGSTGEPVKELQTLLNNKGYKLVVDGDFGNGTLTAVKDFQSKNGLTVDGVVGANTWAKLAYVAPAPKPAPVVAKPATTTPTSLYRVRKSWADASSQLGAFADLNGAKDIVDKNKGYNVYDESGKQVYPVPQSTPTPQPTELYRVRKSWIDGSSQLGAFSSLDGAKTVADQNAGYKVFDSKGNQVYPTMVSQSAPQPVQPVQPVQPKPVVAPIPQVKPEELSGALPSGAVGECVIKAKDLDIYSNYDANSQKIGAVVQGQKFPVYKVVNDFYLIGTGMWISNVGGANADYSPVAQTQSTTVVEPVKPTPVTAPVQESPAPVEPVQPTQPTPVPVIDHTGHHDIMGDSVATFEQMVGFVQSVNPNAQDITEIALNFLEVGREYGMRGDIAFCQSIIETHYFLYDMGTKVTPDQHNYAGIGVTQKGMKGDSFVEVLDGVKAQMQHLFAYASTDRIPNNDAILDPRFQYVTRGICPHWEDLNNHWAMNDQYGQEILAVYDKLISFVPPVKEVPQPVPTPEQPTVPDAPVPHINEADVKVTEGIIDYIFGKIKGLFGK